MHQREVEVTEKALKDEERVWDYIAYGVPSSASLEDADKVIDAF